MLDMVRRWYKRRFSDPDAVSLVVILLFGFITIYFFGNLIAPLLVAIVLAYLLEWPVSKLCALGLPRTLSVVAVILLFISLMLLAIFGLVPTIWNQVGNLLNDIPNMYNGMQQFVATIPERYPDLAEIHLVETIMGNVKDKVLVLGENVVKGSLASLVSLAALAVYLILVPLLVFFLLKDKEEMVSMASGVLPRNRRLANKVWIEMNQQISNYIRGKVLEILIVGTVSYVTFCYSRSSLFGLVGRVGWFLSTYPLYRCSSRYGSRCYGGSVPMGLSTTILLVTCSIRYYPSVGW